MNRYIQKSALVLMYGIVQAINHLFLALDELLYPQYRKQKIVNLLFIVSMPRSGSTWLQSVLCSDTKQLTSMKMWEMLFAPSVIQKKLVLFFCRVDKMINRFFSTKLRKLDAKLFQDYKPAHPSSLFGYEDDDLALLPIFSNLFLFFFFPRLKLYEFLAHFDQSDDERRKKRILKFYKKCIQKHLYVFGSGKQYLSKCAIHATRMQSLYEFFPGSLFICTVRKPEETVISAISLVSNLGRIFHTPVSQEWFANRTLELSDHLFRNPLRCFETWPRERFFVNLYEDQVQDIHQEISSMYYHFGMTVSPEFNEILVMETEKEKTYISLHHYSAEQWNLANNEISLRYEANYQAYRKLASAKPNG